jgi:uncharacterized protein YbaP (TraB family)
MRTVQAQALEAGVDLLRSTATHRGSWLITLMTLELAKRGFDPRWESNQTLAARASTDHKPITASRLRSNRFAVLSSLPLPEQKRFLLMSLEEPAASDESSNRC